MCGFYVVPRARIELATQGFSVLRSTTELPRRGIDGPLVPIDTSPRRRISVVV